MASAGLSEMHRSHRDASSLTNKATERPRGAHTPPAIKHVDLVEPESIRQQHLAAKAKHRKTQLETEAARLPPLVPNPFFTFHMPLPAKTSAAPTRSIKKPRHSAPANPFLQPYHTSNTTYKHSPGNYTRQSQSGQRNIPYELPSSDAIEPVTLQLQDEDVDMMDIDDDEALVTDYSDDPFI